jgi:hypothetical protein
VASVKLEATMRPVFQKVRSDVLMNEFIRLPSVVVSLASSIGCGASDFHLPEITWRLSAARGVSKSLACD